MFYSKVYENELKKKMFFIRAVEQIPLEKLLSLYPVDLNKRRIEYIGDIKEFRCLIYGKCII